MKSIKLLALLFISTLVFTGCSDDENPVEENEEEVITTMTVTLVPQGGGTTVTLVSRDLDGEGGEDSDITGGTLVANKVYDATIKLENETETPAENITDEVAEEDEEHQFFYQAATALNATFAYTGANDENGNPVGITFTVTTGDASTGNMTITLRHEPKKPNDGTLADAGGETDISVPFPITISAATIAK
ncbi:type 1 periplasmic binding fold superfamily protein [Tenacibaculum agarivorans]|uniref:type 1 periplasmic binding fold superfamily protein n=1 Tax=Tenacibaculum agarivorans TaxID=1908389 RepID=UPI00094BADBE|nr:type 1 periplasmic binding fold superfamily protein [Tenacibaculum agarivorans]